MAAILSGNDELRGLLRKAESGNTDAQFDLGWRYANGQKGVMNNDVEAMKWFRKAEAGGNIQAKLYLAYMLRDGRGVEEDETQARKLFSDIKKQAEASPQKLWQFGNLAAKALEQKERSEHSVLDSTKTVSTTHFVVSIMRKPAGQNPEHAFLMVEGRNSFGQSILRRYDLVMSAERPGKAAIIIRPDSLSEHAAETFLEILRGEEVYSLSWNITKEQARVLHKDILADEQNPPNYQVLGDKSLVPTSRQTLGVVGDSSELPESAKGHNCFTWSREKLHMLDDKFKRDLPIKVFPDFIGAKTSWHIKEPKKASFISCPIL